MKYDYRIFGIHVVKIPPGINIQREPGKPKDPALTPIDQVINDKQLEGYEYVSIIPNFNLALAQSTLALPNGAQQPMVLPGACVLMRKPKFGTT